MSRTKRKYAANVLFALLAIAAFADDLSDGERKFKDALNGKIVTLREFYGGNQLRYALDASLQSKAQLCSWTICSKILISDVTFNSDRLLLRGERLAVYFERNSLMEKYSHTRQKVEIEVVSPGSSTVDDFSHALTRIFVTPGTRFSDLVPYYWQGFLYGREQGGPPGQQMVKAPAAITNGSNQVHRVEKRVSAPSILNAPDPQYSQIARQMHKEGTVVLWTVVGEDGKLRDIRIAKPLGFGLDDEAVKAVKLWQLRPALKAGKPIPVQLNIEVNFRCCP